MCLFCIAHVERCVVDTYIEMPSRQLDVLIWSQNGKPGYRINLGHISIPKATEMEGSTKEKGWREKTDQDRALGHSDVLEAGERGEPTRRRGQRGRRKTRRAWYPRSQMGMFGKGRATAIGCRTCSCSAESEGDWESALDLDTWTSLVM